MSKGGHSLSFKGFPFKTKRATPYLLSYDQKPVIVPPKNRSMSEGDILITMPPEVPIVTIGMNNPKLLIPEESEDPSSETSPFLTPVTPTNTLPPTPTTGSPLADTWTTKSQDKPNPPNSSDLLQANRLLVSQQKCSPSSLRKSSPGSSPRTKKIIRWIGVNGHEHHQHHTPPQETKVASPVKIFPKMAETPHIIVSPDVNFVEEEPEFAVAEDVAEQDSPPAAAAAVVEEEEIEEDLLKNSIEEDNPPTIIEISEEEPKDTPLISGESPPPAYESPIQTPLNQTPPLEEPQTDEASLKNDTENRKFFEDDVIMKKKEPLRRTASETNVSQEDISPPINVFALPLIEQTRNESAKPSPLHRHSISNFGNSLKNDNSNYELIEMLHERKTRHHSMVNMMRRASSHVSINDPTTPPEEGPEGGGGFRRFSSKISLMTISGHEAINWGYESMILCVSALYGKLLVVMGMAFPIAEIISHDVPLIFYNTFYLYLYFGSILFLIYSYLFLFRAKALPTANIRQRIRSLKRSTADIRLSEIPNKETAKKLIPKKSNPDETRSEKFDGISMTTSMHKQPKYTITETSNHGSMYLKMGAVLFGVGSMIYSGLEFGQYFELKPDSECGNILTAITPVARMLFIFLQMYFIFLNSRVSISKHTIIARFGLMHMIATNLCIWLNVLVQETEHEIVHLTHKNVHRGSINYTSHILGNPHSMENATHGQHLAPQVGDAMTTSSYGLIHHAGEDGHHSIAKRTTEVDHFLGCRRINIMGHVVNSASPFLFPCTIEYSLLCAGVLYVMWKNINVTKSVKHSADGDSDISNFIARKVRHHYSVDCARASRGLFMGIFVLVLTIISLILFYVLISNEGFTEVAILEANIIELSIYSLSLISVVIGMKQMRELEFFPEGDIELDNILLLIAQCGVYIYTSFTIIGDYFSLEHSPFLSLSTAIITLIQTTLQTLFILDGSRRCCSTSEQHDKKPGREMVTFLLVCNLALWAICTFETSRADVHPTQLQFYGIWAWTIISHVSMPLAIFYRFHVTVCLGEIWKRSYKIKMSGGDSFR